jgi:hypothetical protein
MPTNKVVLRTVEEVMTGYKPTYQPIYPLLLGNSQAYSEEVGKINFNRLNAVGDIRGSRISPKDTEMRQVAVVNGAKTFKKYFFANQFVQSALQSREDIEGIAAQVLDEQQKHMDDLVLLGEGTSASTMINNGLYWSNDPNYVLQTSDEILNAPDTQGELYERVLEQYRIARAVSGSKIILAYGSTMLAKLDSLLPSQPVALRTLIQSALQNGDRLVDIPSIVTPNSANGFIVLTPEQVKLHYVSFPKLQDQGVNDEKMYAWMNFLYGSAMVEVLGSGGILRQPLTFEA